MRRLSFQHWVFLAPLSNTSLLYVLGLIFGLSVVFFWSIFVSILQLYSIAWNQLSVMPPAFLFSQDFFGCLASITIPCFRSVFFFFHFSKKCLWIALKLQIALGSINILTVLILPVHGVIFPFIYVFFIFFHQDLIVFSFLSPPRLNLFLNTLLFLMLL